MVARERFGAILNGGCCSWWQRVHSTVRLDVSSVCAIAHGVGVVRFDEKIDFGHLVWLWLVLLTHEFANQQATYFKRDGRLAHEEDASSLTDRRNKPPGEHGGERMHLAANEPPLK